MFPENREEGGLIRLEATYAVEINLVGYVDSKEDPLTQVVRTHQHNIDSAVLQAARRLKPEVQRETREIKDSIAEREREREKERETKKAGEGRGCSDNCHVTLMKGWWILNSYIGG
jgi:hypothetical protein